MAIATVVCLGPLAKASPDPTTAVELLEEALGLADLTRSDLGGSRGTFSQSHFVCHEGQGWVAVSTAPTLTIKREWFPVEMPAAVFHAFRAKAEEILTIVMYAPWSGTAGKVEHGCNR